MPRIGSSRLSASSIEPELDPEVRVTVLLVDAHVADQQDDAVVAIELRHEVRGTLEVHVAHAQAALLQDRTPGTERLVRLVLNDEDPFQLAAFLRAVQLPRNGGPPIRLTPR
jgi:hypothetical protein